MAEKKVVKESNGLRGLGWFIWGALNIVIAIMVKSINPVIFAAVLFAVGWFRRTH